MRKNTFCLKIASLLLAFSQFTVSGQTPANDAHWQLVWEDNFNTLNTSIWNVRDNFDHWGEIQVFLARNTYIENGNLVLELKHETYSCPSWASMYPDYHCVREAKTKQPYLYTAGTVESKPPYNTRYGYIEARIKFPYHYFLWPTFWTALGDEVINGTNAAEIDIAEMLGETGPNVIQTNVHQNYTNDISRRLDLKPDGYQWTDWHTYGIEWSPTRITWYLDGTPIRTLTDHGMIDPVKLILAIGVRPNIDWRGNPGFNFPYKMYTDYVKVYSLKKDCSNDLNVCNYWFPSYDNKIKKSITIGNGSCTNTVLAGQNIIMRASEGILINGDFTVQTGAELYLDASPCN